jgi:hypothetical protein
MHNIFMFNNGLSRLEVAAQALDNKNAMMDNVVKNSGGTIFEEFFE